MTNAPQSTPDPDRSWRAPLDQRPGCARGEAGKTDPETRGQGESGPGPLDRCSSQDERRRLGSPNREVQDDLDRIDVTDERDTRDRG